MKAVESDRSTAVASHRVFEDVEDGIRVLVGEGRPVKGLTIGAVSTQVNLQLTGDALLEVDDPQRLISADFNSGDLLITLSNINSVFECD